MSLSDAELRQRVDWAIARCENAIVELGGQAAGDGTPDTLLEHLHVLRGALTDRIDEAADPAPDPTPDPDPEPDPHPDPEPTPDPEPAPTPVPAPPPTGAYFVGDFASYTDDATLHAHAGTTTVNNVHAEPGVGMRYDFQAFPNRCADQPLSSVVRLPAGTKEVWLRFKIRFSSNWTTVNPNCTSPSPDYKTVLVWLKDRNAVSGHERFDFKTGTNGTKIHASVPGWPGADVVKPATVQQPGASALFDGQFHDIELHEKLIGDDRALFQVKIDGIVTHNYETKTTAGLSGNWLDKINIGSNRNLGATELMHVWWDDFVVYLSDPGDFNFPAPTTYP